MSASIQQKIGIGLLAFALFGAAWTSFRYFLAELHSFQGKRYERFWEKSGAISSTTQWKRASLHMQRAVFFNNQNPDTLLRAARIQEWYSFTPEPDGDVIRESLDSAHAYYDSALARRQDHGFSYSSRALLRARRWQVDEGISDDLEQAARLAPWERVPLLQIAYAATRAWPSLDADGRDVFLDVLDATALARPAMARQMLEVATEFGQEREICTRLESEGKRAGAASACAMVERQ